MRVCCVILKLNVSTNLKTQKFCVLYCNFAFPVASDRKVTSKKVALQQYYARYPDFLGTGIYTCPQMVCMLHLSFACTTRTRV